MRRPIPKAFGICYGLFRAQPAPRRRSGQIGSLSPGRCSRHRRARTVEHRGTQGYLAPSSGMTTTRPVQTGSAGDAELWRDPTATADNRVTDLMRRMTLREKLGQLYALWVGIDDGGQ